MGVTVKIFAVLLLSAFLAVVSAAKCNGIEGLCDLRFDQITLPGSHNSGSGFDGILRYWSGIACSSCFYRNQGKSFSEQLEFGIRYFDIDTCYRNNEAVNCHCPGGGASGKNCGYNGSVKKGLLQIDRWMKAHPNEVIMIYFGRDIQGGYHKRIAESLQKTLLELWGANKSGLKMNDDFRRSRGWPTLKDAIARNTRIFIMMHNSLAGQLDYTRQMWLVWSGQTMNLLASTWDTVSVSLFSCSGIVDNAKTKCSVSNTFIELSAIGSYGLCTWDMAKVCSKWLGDAQQACYDKRRKFGKTVNILSVDWVDYFSGSESVVNKAKVMNQKNIARYRG